MNHLNGSNIFAILAILCLWTHLPSSNALSIHPKDTRHPHPPPPIPHDAPQKPSTTVHGAKTTTPHTPHTIVTATRRTWCHDRLLSSCIGVLATTTTLLGAPSPTTAAETIGKDPNCADPSCAGVWDGLLADCPHGGLAMNMGAGCASSQDDTPGVFAEPWDYSEAPNDTLDWRRQMDVLIPAIQAVSSRRSDTVLDLTQSGRYLRVLFVDGRTGEKSTGEFYFTPDDTTVQFRVGSTAAPGAGRASSRRNLERCEAVRRQLGYSKLTVLRNRRRAFFFGESGMDGFGPGSAALGPPAEMTSAELEGRRDVDPKLKIDFVQSFPLK